ncbi:ATPase domain-containing protein [Acaryochloris sp. CCMEE 5410]|uniref:ATPase domain-containing protein n=1 Tax=Acaryochloris sp. CCMEE 5410 TaxID=310037 RepID=UPI0002DE0C03|nr:ATPase domain-containing protein [Acaryochloris sp. CCMEE 5410]KAI9132286.1 AAA family ATPase [Acaryochloris sp. CCMEE 5410]
MPTRISTCVRGLDDILQNGFISGQAYLLRGGTGTGKTTLGMHYLRAGVAQHEPTLLITLGEPEQRLRRNAANIGIDLEGISVLDLTPSKEYFAENLTYDIFSPADVEREPTTQRIMEEVHRIQPQRVFIDSMTQFRYLATDKFQFHKQVLSFIRFLTDQGCTVLLTSESTASDADDDLQFLCDGVIDLAYNRSDDTRALEIAKFRGSDFRGGTHAFRLTNKGMSVFPRLRPESFANEFVSESISSGVPEIDELLHGGIERGTITVVSGSSGVGKTTFGLQFMKEAAGRGERSVVYSFEENIETMLHRCEGVNIPVAAMLKQGTLSAVQVEALLLSPDEFAQQVRQEVEQHQARIVMLDSISGYQLSIRGGELIKRIHALCRYLQNMGVTVILINETESITGEFKATGMGISYLADNIIFLRHLEVRGELHKAIGVLKKRLSGYENTLREFEITRYGLKVGPPLTKLRRILSGIPDWVNEPPQEC